MKKVILLLLLYLVSLLAEEKSGADTIEVITEVFAPYNYLEEDSLVGSCTETMRALLAEVGLDSLQIKVYPWFRALEEVRQKKNVLLFSLIRNKDREQKFKWVGIIDSTEIGVITLAQKAITMEKTEDLKKFRTVVYSKGPMLDYLRKKAITAKRIEEWEAGIRLLVNDRIDVYPTSLEAFFYTTEKMGYPREMFKVIYDLPELEEKLWAAFSPSTPDSTVERFRKALRQINKKR